MVQHNLNNPGCFILLLQTGLGRGLCPSHDNEMRFPLWRQWGSFPTNKVKWQRGIIRKSDTELRQVPNLKAPYSIIITPFIVKTILSGYLSLVAKSTPLNQDAFTWVPDSYLQIFVFWFDHMYLKYTYCSIYIWFKRELLLFHQLNLIFWLSLDCVFVLKLQSLMSSNPG